MNLGPVVDAAAIEAEIYRIRSLGLVVVPEEADTVRSIFQQYLELGSIGALVQDLDCNGIRTKRRAGAKDRMNGACGLAWARSPTC